MKHREEMSDEELFIMFQHDDPLAFSILYDRHWANLIKKALHKLSDQVAAEEVVQNVFVNLWKWKENIVLKGELRYYVYTMLRNEIFRYLEDRFKHSTTIPIDEIASSGFVSLDNDGHERIEYLELQDKITRIVDGLPDKCRLIFQMSRDEGMTAKQIAGQLNISHRTVETQLSKAIRTLKNAIRKVHILLYS
ncbi:RNA polymerase sigma-70 factor [Sphingobacterium siyangense]|uniref:RNA polymerase sigma-70 factor n=1 Tax=Sphingobacterium TaxID=28453 RepID=UPI00200F9600|nr:MULTISPECIES: RNA polymerase sigma-70 factor [Sphingobacterium]UQA74162.1 RNA polymerase sigma-70 factor [Sphingobacterium siyangense]